ncbi:MAG: NAD/NADP transhydrogenase alpha subunit [Gammaproteobacteria bacterium]|jgi:NAD/NADP transhydrogenase alpha subunit
MRVISDGCVMAAMTRTVPPQRGQVLMSIANTRRRRCIQLMALMGAVGVASSGIGRRGGCMPCDNVLAMSGMRREQAMVTHQMRSRTRYQGGKARNKVEWFEQHVGGAIAQWMLERVDHQAIAVDAQPIQGDRPSGDVTTNTLQLFALMSFARDGRVQ